MTANFFALHEMILNGALKFQISLVKLFKKFCNLGYPGLGARKILKLDQILV